MENVKKSMKNNSSILTYSIADFIDLSLVEILTLELLLRHSEAVIRHTLFLEVAQFLDSEQTSLDSIDKKKLDPNEKRYFQFVQKSRKFSTSSFYNNLKNLEERGLITSNLNEKGKIESIEITSLTRPLIEVILRHFIRFGVRAEEITMEAMKKAILEQIGRIQFESLFVIWLNEYIDINILRIAKNVSRSMFILSKEDFSKELENTGFKGINFSSIYNKKIREPNKIFDLTFFPFYYRDSELFGLNLTDCLKEAVRVTKKDGVIIITAQAKLPRTEGFLLNKLIDIYEKANAQTIYEIEELEQHFKDVGISNMKVFKFEGDLIGIGWVS